MKQLSYILLFILFVGCSDDYLDVLPKGQAIPENTDQLNEMLNATMEVNYHGGNFNYSTDQVWGAPFLMSAINIAQYTWADFPFDEVTDDPNWNACYKAIGISNYVLENIDAAKIGNQYDPVETKARALFIRANAYFMLINSYAKHYNETTASSDLGVPILLTYDMTSKEPRSTVEQVYQRIFNDLEACIDGLPEDVEFRSIQSKPAVNALYARIYLYQGKFDLAANYALKAIDGYDFLHDYNTLVLNNPAMPLFGIQGFNASAINNKESIYGHTANEGANIFYDTDALNEYEDSDFRKTLFIQNPELIGMPPLGHLMIVNMGYSADAALTVPEAILNYCEALMMQNSPNETLALEYLNKLRDMRYVSGTTHDDSDVLASVKRERKLELRYSALRWWDMKRWGLSVTREFGGETYTLTAQSPNYVFAIPPKVMQFNELLEQNPRGL